MQLYFRQKRQSLHTTMDHIWLWKNILATYVHFELQYGLTVPLPFKKRLVSFFTSRNGKDTNLISYKKPKQWRKKPSENNKKHKQLEEIRKFLRIQFDLYNEKSITNQI